MIARASSPGRAFISFYLFLLFCFLQSSYSTSLLFFFLCVADSFLCSICSGPAFCSFLPPFSSLRPVVPFPLPRTRQAQTHSRGTPIWQSQMSRPSDRSGIKKTRMSRKPKDQRRTTKRARSRRCNRNDVAPRKRRRGSRLQRRRVY